MWWRWFGACVKRGQVVLQMKPACCSFRTWTAERGRGKRSCHTRPYFSTSHRLWHFIYSGLYKTRFLWEQSCFLCGRRPVCLSARVRECGEQFFRHLLTLHIFIPIHTSSYSPIPPLIRVSYILGCQGNRVISSRQGSCLLGTLSSEMPVARGHLENVVLLCVAAYPPPASCQGCVPPPWRWISWVPISQHPPQLYYSESYPGFHPRVENVTWVEGFISTDSESQTTPRLWTHSVGVRPPCPHPTVG